MVDAAPSGKKNVDLISNLIETYFVDMPRANMVFIDALIEGKATYFDILKKFEGIVPNDRNAHVVIRGEEDNIFNPGQ
jgi:hypothetical protein